MKRLIILLLVAGAASASFSQTRDTVTVFGPQRFVRTTRRPAVVDTTFSVPEGALAPFVLHVYTGSLRERNNDQRNDKDRRGNSRFDRKDNHKRADERDFRDEDVNVTATIWINGRAVVSPNDFRRHGSDIERRVRLHPTNVLRVRMEGDPGTYVVLMITGGGVADNTPPQVTLTSPASGTITRDSTVTVSGTATDQSTFTLQVNGVTVPVTDSSFSVPVTLSEGMNVITIVATDAYNNTSAQTLTVIKDSIPPTLVVTGPADGLITRDTTITVSGAVADSTAVTVTVNGANVTVEADSFSTKIPLTEGVNTITIAATDAAGNTTTATRTITRDTIPPTLSISSPSDSSATNQSVVLIKGTVSDSTSITLKVNGIDVEVTNGSFSALDTLTEGFDAYTVVATDAAGNTTTLNGIIRLYTIPPALTVTFPGNGYSTTDSTVTVTGNVSDSTKVTMTANGVILAISSSGSFSGTIPLPVDSSVITVLAVDAAGNESSETISVFRVPLPPDPSTVAPKIDPTVVTTVSSATKFLYTGSNPIQTGVDTAMMSYVRAAAIRGRVLKRDGEPLAGVTVSILNHPEYGQTLTRADGMYDMAINGGGQLTINFSRDGYLTAQRQVNTPWQSFGNVEDIVLVQLDPKVTVVKLGGDSISVARGSVVSGERGERQSTLIFKPGTRGTMEIVHYAYDTVASAGDTELVKVPTDTTSVPLDSMSVRATEYTVGTNGQEAMPAKLPSATAYTYCVELSSDEAIAAGANTIEFSKPIVDYVDNFLNFPVGVAVPSGYYDKSKGEWMAMQDGVVMEILDTTAGVASVDLNGTGVAADTAQLDSAGIDSLELKELASLYSPGRTLWRMPLRHFSTDDFNAFYLPLGTVTLDTLDFHAANQDPLKVHTSCGSIIGVQDQSLGQSVDVTGAPFSMYYNSKNTGGYVHSRVLDLPLTGSILPAQLIGVDLIVNVAGEVFTRHFTPAPNLTYQYVWDGKDAYGRRVQGDQPAEVSVGYVYMVDYAVHSNSWEERYSWDQRVAEGTAIRVPFPPVTMTYVYTDWRKWHTTFYRWNVQGEKLGGWNPDIHERYDPAGRRLYNGDGSVRDAGTVVNLAAVPGTTGNGWGGPGRSGTYIVFAPDGTMYFSMTIDCKVWKRRPDGSVVLVAGTGQTTYNGDGIPATSANLAYPRGLALGKDGSLYIAEGDRIRKVDPFGIITTYAGTGAGGFSGDGGPAVDAEFNYPRGLVMGPEGNLYLADANNNRIRMISPAGIVTTVAGNGTKGFAGDGGSATEAELNQPYGVDMDLQGNLYIADYSNRRIRKVSPAGIITTVAGDGHYSTTSSYHGDGGPATAAELDMPTNVTVARDGSIYIDDYPGYCIRTVDPDGIINTFYGGNKLVPKDQWNHYPFASAISPDGIFYFSEDIFYLEWGWAGVWGGSSIHKIFPPFPGVSAGELDIASEDGSEVYVFDANGRHLRTLDALTGVKLYSFTYDSLGLLTSIADRNNQVTRIQRAQDGTPLAVISPYGQRTLLNVDSSGYLSSIIDPAGDTTRYTYTASGLMTSLTDARGHTHTFEYDSLGCLIYDRDPAGGYKILTRSNTANGYSVTVSTRLGDKSVYRISSQPTGGQVMTTTDANDLTDSTTYDTQGSSTVKTHDGITTETTLGPDPRFGMQAPVIKQRTVTTPGGLQSVTLETRTVTQMVGSTIGQLTDNFSVNGRNYKTMYDGTKHRFTTTSPMGRNSFTFVDTLGRVVEDSIPGILPVKYAYDGRGRLTTVAQGTRVSYFTYDSLGRIQLATDPMGHTSGFAYDSVGRVTVQTLPDGKVITFTYDANGNLITLTPPGRPEHMFAYDVNDLTVSYTPPVVGDTLGTMNPEPGTPNPEPGTTNYSYDLDKRLVTTSLPDGRSITIAYDTSACGCGGTASRIRSITYDRGTQTFAYDAKGNIAQTVTPEGDTLLYGYDGSLPTSVTWRGTVNGSVGVTYDKNFNVTGQTIDGGNNVSFGYDNDGLLTSVGPMTLSYNSQNGLLTGTQLDSITTSQTYDSYGDLSSYKADYSNSPIFQDSFVRDSLGRITGKTEDVEGTTEKLNYAYDAVGRLTKVWRNDTLISTYSYDANGNRIARWTPTGIDSGTYDAQDRMLSYGGAEYFYTANGDLREKISGTDTTKYTYDVLGNLTQVVMPNGDIIQYVVGGQNRRIARKVNGRITNKWLYGGQLTPIAELDSANNVIERFSGGFLEKNDSVYEIITDQLGSPRLVVNVATGVVVQRIDYDAFGNVTYDSNPGFQPLGFAGGLYDPETRLVRFGARDYDANMGRWTNRDPIQFRSRATNLYEYVLSDPINRLDQAGLCIDIPTAPSGVDLQQNIHIAEQHVMLPATSADNIAMNVYNILWFTNMVRKGGAWDYLTKYHSMKYDDFGNFNYGAVGRAMGLDEITLLKGAGWEQVVTDLLRFPKKRIGSGSPLSGPPFGDDQAGQTMIRLGYLWHSDPCPCRK